MLSCCTYSLWKSHKTHLFEKEDVKQPNYNVGITAAWIKIQRQYSREQKLLKTTCTKKSTPSLFGGSSEGEFEYISSNFQSVLTKTCLLKRSQWGAQIFEDTIKRSLLDRKVLTLRPLRASPSQWKPQFHNFAILKGARRHHIQMHSQDWNREDNYTLIMLQVTHNMKLALYWPVLLCLKMWNVHETSRENV